jgi:RNA polymerase sigma-70 factor (ECF subfamily)
MTGPNEHAVNPEAWPLHGRRRFPTTRWTLICTAKDKEDADCAAALEELCRIYWYPLYAYVRQRGYSAEDAEDLTQAFFHRLLDKEYLQAASEDKGKFRTFLLVAMKRFVADEWRRAQAQKRGGRSTMVPIDSGWAENRYAIDPAEEMTPEKLYERECANVLLEQAWGGLRKEMERSGKERLFEALKHTLIGSSEARPYGEIAMQLEMTEGAVKWAAYRMRKRFRHYLRMAIAETVSTPGEIEDEVRHLFSVFST